MKKIDNCENSTVLVGLLLAGILLVMGGYRIFSYLCDRGAVDTATYLLGAAGDSRSAAGQPQFPAAEGAASVKACFCNFPSIFRQRSGIMSRSADVPMQHLPESFACLAAFPAPGRR